ncbi:MAG: hypothetical protein RMI94_12920 [Bryobacterales bacterium]|nr:hypothetical protein [Bryobacteraceae bacterium]MDW8131445.1 hypothetical protein [Bryobacterales bacterium]
MANFLLSVGLARAMAQESSLEWQPTQVPWIIKALYFIRTKMPKECAEPGAAVFDIAPTPKLYELAGDFASEWQSKFYERLHTNPAAALQYIQNLEKIRTSYLEAVYMRMHAAGHINQEVDRLWTGWIKVWSTIKLGASMGLATVGLVAGIAGVAGISAITLGRIQLTVGDPQWAFTVIGGVTNLILTNIPSFDLLGSAKVIALAGAQEGFSQGLQSMGDQVSARTKELQRLIQECESLIKKYSAELGERYLQEWGKLVSLQGYTEQWIAREQRSVTAPVSKSVIADRMTSLQAYQKELQSKTKCAPFLKGLQYALPIVFFGLDVWEALQTYRKELKAADS